MAAGVSTIDFLDYCFFVDNAYEAGNIICFP